MAKKSTIKKPKHTADDIALGDRVKDKITNFTGIVTGRCNYISGCDQILVQGTVDENNKKGDANWIDIDRCEVVEKGVIKIEEVSNVERPGGDLEAPVK